jgi:hypothetical protein
MGSQASNEPVQRETRLSIPAPFEDALRAILKVKPAPEPEKPKRRKQPRPARKKPA